MKVRAGHAPGKGRGVFAAAPISRGEVIVEECTVGLSAADCDALESTPAGDYYFAHPEDEDLGLLVLGLDLPLNFSSTWI